MGCINIDVRLDAAGQLCPNTVIECNIRADTVPCQIPLLISRSALRQAAGVLDFSRNTLSVIGRYVIPLRQYENGHLGFTVSRRLCNSTTNPVVIMVRGEFRVL